MSRSLDFTACNLPCEHPCWRRLTKEEIEWLEKNPNRQAYTFVCLEKQNDDDFRKKFNTIVDFCVKNGLDKRDSRTQDCIDKIKECKDD